MFNRFKSQWTALKRSRPGNRFQDRFERHQRSKNAPKAIWRVVRVIAAAGFVALGVIFMFIPGPAIVFYAIAGALLSTDSRPVARALDWCEVRGRKLGRWIAARWNPLPMFAKLTLGAIGACGSVTSTWLFYRFVAH